MPPRGFTNPAPKTESARSALSAFTCTLCNKSYSRHPEYEAHIGSYDHQHRKRLQDLKQLSRDPNAAERARRAEKKADAEAGLKKLDDSNNNNNNNSINNNAAAVSSTGGRGGTAGGGGFKKGGFKSSFTAVKGAATATVGGRKNVLGDDEDEDADLGETEKKTASAALATTASSSGGTAHRAADADAESDTDDDEYGYQNDGDDAYYDPAKPTGCNANCPSLVSA